MRARSLALLVAAGCAGAPTAAPTASPAAAPTAAPAGSPTGSTAAPGDWPIVYRQDFASPASLAEVVCSDPANWRWSDAAGRASLELLAGQHYAPPFRSPEHIALLGDIEVADFDLDADLLQTGRDYGHRDLCLFFGFQSPERFYYVHLAPAPDPHAHNVFRVDGAPRAALAPVPAHGVDWGRDEWHHVRIERRVGPGTIRVFWDGGAEPILTATCARFDRGRLGFGSFDDSGRFANVVVKAPAVRPVSGPRDPFAR